MGQSMVQVDRTVRNGACHTQVPDMHFNIPPNVPYSYKTL